METFLTVEDAAQRLAVTPYTLREWLKAGHVRGAKIGRQWRVPESALDELARGTNAPLPQAARPALAPTASGLTGDGFAASGLTGSSFTGAPSEGAP